MITDTNTKDPIIRQNTLMIGSIFSESWHKVKGVKGTFIGAYLVLILFEFLFLGTANIIDYVWPTPSNTFVNIIKIIYPIAMFLVMLPLVNGIFLLGIHRAASRPIQIKMLFANYGRRFYRILLLYILLLAFYAITFFIILFIAKLIAALTSINPGFITITLMTILLITSMVYFFMALLLLLDRENIGVIQSLKLSFKAAHHHFFKILIIIIACVLITVISVIPFGIGLIWSIPWTMIAYGVLYRELFNAESLPQAD